MRTFRELKAFSETILADAGLSKVQVYPGPEVEDIPNETLVWTPFSGAGLDLDGALDRRSWQARSIGAQEDYESAEDIANVIDIAFISHFSSKVGDVWVPSIERVGGAPTVLMKDDAGRTHFVCSYVISVESALPN